MCSISTGEKSKKTAQDFSCKVRLRLLVVAKRGIKIDFFFSYFSLLWDRNVNGPRGMDGRLLLNRKGMFVVITEPNGTNMK